MRESSRERLYLSDRTLARCGWRLECVTSAGNTVEALAALIFGSLAGSIALSVSVSTA
jgi:hypothetical protein